METYAVGKDFAEFLLHSYNQVDNLSEGVKCYVAREVIDSGAELYLFGGPDGSNLYRVARYFVQAGIMKVYLDFFRFVRFYPQIRDIEQVEFT